MNKPLEAENNDLVTVIRVPGLQLLPPPPGPYLFQVRYTSPEPSESVSLVCTLKLKQLC